MATMTRRSPKAEQKSWNHGWNNRRPGFSRRMKRGVEKAFRVTERDDVEEGLADAEGHTMNGFPVPDPLFSRKEILSRISYIREEGYHGSLPGSLEDEWWFLEDLLDEAV